MLDQHIDLVKQLIDGYERNAKLYGPTGKTPNNGNYSASAARLQQLGPLLEYLVEQKRLAAPIPKSLGDISDLPDELVKELSLRRTDELEDQILTVMRACEGPEVSLDQVLVGLYRKFKVVQTRRFIQNKLYRMWKKDLIFQVPGHRAAYSLEAMPEPELAALGGEEGYGERGERPSPVQDLDDDVPF